MKRCSHCKKELPFARFNRNRAKADGYANECKECAAKRTTPYNIMRYKTDEEWRKRNNAACKAYRERKKAAAAN